VLRHTSDGWHNTKKRAVEGLVGRSMAICKATLKNYKECKNKARPQSDYCGVHMPKEEKKHHRNKKGELHCDGDLPAVDTLLEQKWYKNGLLHREGDNPAVIKKTPATDTICYEYYVNGKKHRDGDLPAEITLVDNQVVREEYYKNGKLHRDDDKPARTGILKMFLRFVKLVDGELFYESRECSYDEYYKNGRQHRENDKPASIVRLPDNVGPNLMEYYYINGELHREGDKPAVISRCEDECREEYYVNGQLHREKGYAKCYYHFYKGECTSDLIEAMGRFYVRNRRNKEFVRFMQQCAQRWRLKVALEWRPPHGVQYEKMMSEYSDEL